MKIREVWNHNLDQELSILDRSLHRFPLLSIDTEFPGCLRNTPRDASGALRYNDLKFNVDNTHMIQLGVTLSDHFGNVSFSWEFNFCNFDLNNDLYAEPSIEFLKKFGLDFERIRKHGVDMHDLRHKFLAILSMHNNLGWITFHGLYDLAYVLKLFTNTPLPVKVFDFVKLSSVYFKTVFDIKFIARFCKGLMDGELGLARLAKILNVNRLGDAHNAGSDSLLTAAVFAKINKVYKIHLHHFEGFLYGISERIQQVRPRMARPQYCQPCVPFSVYPQNVVYFSRPPHPLHFGTPLQSTNIMQPKMYPCFL